MYFLSWLELCKPWDIKSVGSTLIYIFFVSWTLLSFYHVDLPGSKRQTLVLKHSSKKHLMCMFDLCRFLILTAWDSSFHYIWDQIMNTNKYIFCILNYIGHRSLFKKIKYIFSLSILLNLRFSVTSQFMTNFSVSFAWYGAISVSVHPLPDSDLSNIGVIPV